MIYSINPFKWLVWFGLKWKYWKKYSTSKWRNYHYPQKLLSKEGKAEMTKMLRAAVIRHDFIRILRRIYMDEHVWKIKDKDND